MEPPSPARCLRLDLEYDGSDFLGWQRQAEGRTVQGTVEAALERILGRPHAVIGAGRTDAGVHARGMVASFRTDHGMSAPDLARALDAVLPRDVGVLAAREAPPAFHALRDARWKWYRYSLLRTAHRRPLLRRTTWHVWGPLDARTLEAGTRALEGRHDFAAFASTGSPRRGTVRTLYAVRWTDAGDVAHFDFVGDGFLYRMVRSIVGTLVHAARGRVPPAVLPDAVEPASAADPPERLRIALAYLLDTGRRAPGPLAPARGLCLMGVGTATDGAETPLPHFLRSDVESALRRAPGGLH